MPRQVYVAFNLFAIAAIVFVGVDIFYNIVRVRLAHFEIGSEYTVPGPGRVGRQGPTDRSYQVIVDRNLFNATGKQEPEAGAVQISGLEPTSLQVSLLGTIAGDEQSARAIIEDQQKKEQDLYRVGDTIQNAIVSRILRGKVVLKVDGRDEILTMEEKNTSADQESGQGNKAGQRTTAALRTGNRNTVILDRREISESLDNIGDILSQVRVEPYMQNGRATGLQVSDIAPASIFDRMGLEDGDIVQAVNNRQIRSPDDVVAFYQGLKSASRLTLLITRDGRRKVLNYNIRE
jgi:general secretion pathway protein C